MLNASELAYCNVLEWRDAGYDGTGIKIAVREVITSKINPNLYGGKVIVPYKWVSRIDTTITTSHAHQVVDSILQIAPNAEIHMLGGHSVMEDLQYCLDNNINMVNMSTNSYWYNTSDNAVEQQLLDKGCILFCCAGNDGSGGLWQSARKDKWISVGAVAWKTWLNVTGPYRTNYSSYDVTGPYLDVMGFGDIVLPSGVASGTSFACPWVVGLVAVWSQWFKQKNGYNPTFFDAMLLIKSNAKDVEAVGYDVKTGYGVLTLPALTAIPKEQDVLEMIIGNKTATLNGTPIPLVVAPQLVNNSTVVGLRDVATVFGWVVTWDKTTQTITMVKDRE